MQTGHDEEELVQVGESNEWFEKLLDNGVAEDWQQDREIEVEREEETDTYMQD